MPPLKPHRHTGTDSEKIFGGDLVNAPQTALTTKNSSALSSGGVGSISNADNLILENMKTRINELETKLQNLGLLN